MSTFGWSLVSSSRPSLELRVLGPSPDTRWRYDAEGTQRDCFHQLRRISGISTLICSVASPCSWGHWPGLVGADPRVLPFESPR
jgi:hypothetical protein